MRPEEILFAQDSGFKLGLIMMKDYEVLILFLMGCGLYDLIKRAGRWVGQKYFQE